MIENMLHLSIHIHSKYDIINNPLHIYDGSGTINTYSNVKAVSELITLGSIIIFVCMAGLVNFV